jgi:hypothetical protein
MRSKRETDGGKTCENVSDKRNSCKSKTTENSGETFVRLVTGMNSGGDARTNATQQNDPFGVSKSGTNTTTKVSSTQDTDERYNENSNNSITPPIPTTEYTKFHLEDDEMLMELMMHLHSDCPDMLTNKQSLLNNVSRLFDEITK